MKAEMEQALEQEFLVEGHLKDLAILTDELGHIFYTTASGEELPVGCVAGMYDLHSISELPEREQEEIREFL